MLLNFKLQVWCRPFSLEPCTFLSFDVLLLYQTSLFFFLNFACPQLDYLFSINIKIPAANILVDCWLFICLATSLSVSSISGLATQHSSEWRLSLSPGCEACSQEDGEDAGHGRKKGVRLVFTDYDFRFGFTVAVFTAVLTLWTCMTLRYWLGSSRS